MNDHSIIFDIIDFCIVFFGYCIQESTICRWKAKEKKMKEKEKEKATPVAVESNTISAFIFFPWKFHDNWILDTQKMVAWNFGISEIKNGDFGDISMFFISGVCFCGARDFSMYLFWGLWFHLRNWMVLLNMPFSRCHQPPWSAWNFSWRVAMEKIKLTMNGNHKSLKMWE